MFCPLCKAEYREGFDTCADCSVSLVAELPREEGLGELVEVYQTLGKQMGKQMGSGLQTCKLEVVFPYAP